MSLIQQVQRGVRTIVVAAITIGFVMTDLQSAYATPESPQTSKEYLERGIERSDRGEYFAAIEDYTQALKLDPNHPLIFYDRGIALTHLHRYEAAISDYTNAIRFKYDLAAAYKNRGLVYIQWGQHLKEAIADYNQAIELEPEDAASYLGKGLALSLDDKKREALESLTQAIKLDPTLAIAYFTRATVYHDLREKAAALADYQKAATLYQQQGDETSYQKTLGAIKELN